MKADVQPVLQRIQAYDMANLEALWKQFTKPTWPDTQEERQVIGYDVIWFIAWICLNPLGKDKPIWFAQR